MPDNLAPWLAIAGLGAFHGINPAMGWLFAVALGLNRRSRGIVWSSLVPIALGHAMSVLAVVELFLIFGGFVSARQLEVAGGLMLIGWAAYHVCYGHRSRVRVGMTTGFAGLCLWSFLLATSHGAGLMLIPFVSSICFPEPFAPDLDRSNSWASGLRVISVHTGAMLLVTATTAALVYEVVGLAFIRRAWLNLDLLWAICLAGAGILLFL